MSPRAAAFALSVVLVLSCLVLVAPRAAADWCTSSFMSYAPGSGSAGSSVTFSFTFENMLSVTIQVSDFSATYSWGGFSDFGVFVVGPYSTITGTSTQTLPSTAGAESLYATVTGQANTDYFPIGCSFGPMPFTVNTPTPLSATASATPTTTDVGTSVAFTCAASGGSSPYSYAWAFGDGKTGTGASVSHAYASAGRETATCTATDSASAHTSAVASVVVNPAPSTAITSAYRAAAPGTALPFAASASNGTPPFTFAWSFGDGGSATGANVSHAYANPGSFTTQVTATDAAGGTSTASAAIVIARLVPVASASAYSPSAGTDLTFTATASGGAAPYAYLWTFGDGSTATGATAHHTYASPGNYTSTLRVTDALGTTNVTTLTIIRVSAPSGLPSLLSPEGLPYLAAGIVAAAVAVTGVGLYLRRRKKPPSAVNSEPAPVPPK